LYFPPIIIFEFKAKKTLFSSNKNEKKFAKFYEFLIFSKVVFFRDKESFLILDFL